MEPEYDERGNIPGPGPGSLKNFEIPRWQSEEDEAVLNKENKVIDQLREGTLDVGKQILDSFVYGGAVGVPAMRTLTKIPKLPVSGHKTINITPKGVNTQQGSKILNEAFSWKRFHSNSITQRERLLSPQGLYPKGDNPSLPITDFDQGSIPGLDGQDYAFKSEYYSSKFPETTKKDLGLYSANIRTFNKFDSIEDALSAGEISNQELLDTGKKRWPGIDAQIGNNYYKIYKGPNNSIKVLPYNKWHQLRRSPFRVPDDVKAELKLSESRQIEMFDENDNIVKYDKGTVDKFVKYVNTEIGYQKKLQREIEAKAKADAKEKGIKYVRGKSYLSKDLSHAVPKSKGGAGYTFLEAWRENQSRGNRDILDDQTLIDLGIPRNWKEYFLRWHQEQGTGNPATDLGKLADISWDDYDAAQKGEDINTIKLRRKDINNLINKQIGNSNLHLERGSTKLSDGTIGTVADDFEQLIRISKGLDQFADISEETPTFHPDEFDLVLRAKNWNSPAKGKVKMTTDQQARKMKNQVTKKTNLESRQTQRETKRKEDEGQGKFNANL